MENLKVLYLNDTERSEWEGKSKGYRNDVYVKVGNKLFNIKVYDMVRLQQDYELEIQTYGYYSIEPNLVLVKDVSKEEIEFVVRRLFEQNYFENIQPIDDENIYSHFEKMQITVNIEFIIPGESFVSKLVSTIRTHRVGIWK